MQVRQTMEIRVKIQVPEENYCNACTHMVYGDLHGTGSNIKFCDIFGCALATSIATGEVNPCPNFLIARKAAND